MVGPTAAGKSAWALEQAARVGGSIVNIDSVQFYRGLVIGSAAPSEDEKARVPHYLYSYVEAPAEMTAGRFVQDFHTLIAETPGLRFPLFIVGGTGFYVQALEKGMFDVEPAPPELRRRLEAELAERGAEALHAELRTRDPGTRIHVNDHFRLVRALEIIRHTGQVPSRLRERPELNKNGFPFPYLKIGFDLEKEALAARVRERSRRMVADGIIEETAGFLGHGFHDWAPLQSVGYRETAEFIQAGGQGGGEARRERLADAITQSTRQLVKKQRTWFKRDPSILWSKDGQQDLDWLSDRLDQFLSTV